MASETPTTTKSSFWICTLNNPTDDERALLKSPPHYIKEMWGQDEKAPTTGTLHIQIGMRTDQIRKSIIVNDFPRMWIGKANCKKGLIDYCSKKESAIPDTQWHYVKPTNDITEPNEPEYLSGHQILELIAFWVRETDTVSDLLTPEQMYEQAVNDICTYQPELATKVCGTRILPMWKILFRVFLHRVNLLMDIPDEEPIQPSTEWQGICEGCDKDECLPCGLIYLSKL